MPLLCPRTGVKKMHELFSEELDCPNLGTLKHGYIEHDGCCAPGDVVEFFCDEDFELEGAANATCQYNGFWSEPKPTCRSECIAVLWSTTGG